MAKRILIVDDDASILDMTSLVLGKKGYEVSVAANGVRALEEIKKRLPDLILTDVIMPEMDGYFFYKELKKNPLTAGIPVLIITARGKMEDTFKVMGVDGFIAKPILPEVLYAEIEHMFRVMETRKDIQDSDKEDINKKVLIVTQDAEILKDMKYQAQRAGYTVDAATSGAEAVTRVVKFLPDIIFVDVLVEDIRAGEIVQVVRRLQQFEEKPILGFCYYKTDDLGDPRVRQKIIGIHEASQQMLHCGGTSYMGRYQPQLFIKVLKDHLRKTRE